MRHRIRRITASLPLLLGGCVSLHSNQPVQQQYVLTLPPAGAGNASGPPGSSSGSGSTHSLQVLLPTVAAGLSGEGIAVLRSGQRLDYFSDARWAESVPTMLQLLLIEALRRQGTFRLVETESGPFAAGYVLSVDVTHFEADYGTAGGSGPQPPSAHVTLVCTLGRRSDGSAVTTLTVNSTVSAQANRMQAVVEAFQHATDQALRRVAQQLTPPQ